MDMDCENLNSYQTGGNSKIPRFVPKSTGNANGKAKLQRKPLSPVSANARKRLSAGLGLNHHTGQTVRERGGGKIIWRKASKCNNMEQKDPPLRRRLTLSGIPLPLESKKIPASKQKTTTPPPPPPEGTPDGSTAAAAAAAAARRPPSLSAGAAAAGKGDPGARRGRCLSEGPIQVRKQAGRQRFASESSKFQGRKLELVRWRRRRERERRGGEGGGAGGGRAAPAASRSNGAAAGSGTSEIDLPLGKAGHTVINKDLAKLKELEKRKKIMLPPTVRHYLQEFEQELAFEEGLEEGGCNEGKRQEDDEEERSDFLDDDDDYDRQHDEQVEARDEAQDIIEKIEQASNKMRKEEKMAATELSPLSEKRIEEALMMELDLHKSPVRPAEGSVVQVIQVSKEQETSGLNVTENYFRSPAERQGACTVPAYQNTKTNMEKQHSPGIVLDLDNFLLQEFDAECTKKNKHGVIFDNLQGKAGKVKGKNTARSSTKIRADRGDVVVNEQKQPINVDSVQKDCNTTANKDISEAQDYFERGEISLAIALTFLALVMGHCAGSVFLFAVLAVREFYG